MRRNIQAIALSGAALAAAVGLFAAPFAAPVDAAKVEKVELCHWSENDNVYVEVEVAAKQIAKGKGHARHEHDRLVPAEGCASLPDPEA